MHTEILDIVGMGWSHASVGWQEPPEHARWGLFSVRAQEKAAKSCNGPLWNGAHQNCFLFRWFIVEVKQIKRVKKVLDACPALGHICSDSDVWEGTRVFVHVGCSWWLIHFLGSRLHPAGCHLDNTGLPIHAAWPLAELRACDVMCCARESTNLFIL